MSDKSFEDWLVSIRFQRFDWSVYGLSEQPDQSDFGFIMHDDIADSAKLRFLDLVNSVGGYAALEP